MFAGDRVAIEADLDAHIDRGSTMDAPQRACPTTPAVEIAANAETATSHGADQFWR